MCKYLAFDHKYLAFDRRYLAVAAEWCVPRFLSMKKPAKISLLSGKARMLEGSQPFVMISHKKVDREAEIIRQ